MKSSNIRRNLWATLSARLAVFTGVWGCVFAAKLSAEPAWWTGDHLDVLKAAEQSNRLILIYFESPAAEDCMKMTEETWKTYDPALTEKKFIFWKIAPDESGAFLFEKFDVYQTPEIVVVDGKTREKARIKGYIGAKELDDQLALISKGGQESEIVINSDGTTQNLKENQAQRKETRRKNEEEAQKAREQQKKKNYFLFEDFDVECSTLEQLNARVPFNAYVNPLRSFYLDLTGGKYNSHGLFISTLKYQKIELDLPTQPAMAVMMDISKGLDKVQLIEGRLRVTMDLRSVSLLDGKAIDVGFVSIVPKDQKPPSIRELKANGALTNSFTLMNQQRVWQSKSTTTPPFNFRTNKAYLHLWVDFLKQGYYIDNLRVEVLSPTEDTAEQTIAQTMPEPDDIFKFELEEGIPREFVVFDKNKNGRLERSEIPADFNKNMQVVRGRGVNFDKDDKDKNGYLDVAEWNNRGR